ncbi:phosphatidic acid phosphatase type 2/haloperoxidase [Flagelloscypha sp. PMI_526]|nr:phosphatidic acid phosphatase type 2/haloperoxidase [Flagelloscypha sp. PMI_526]
MFPKLPLDYVHATPAPRATSPARRRKLLFSYLPDWCVITAGAFFALEPFEGFRRTFSLADTSLRHEYTVHERIPNLLLLIISFVAPLVLMPVMNFFTVRSLWDWHNSSLGLVLSLCLTGAITQFTKVTVGRPRPDLISRCDPPPGSVDPEFGLSNSSICRQTDAYMMRDGFRSFPSGHSSLSFAGLGFLAFYLAGKLHLFDRRGHAGKAWLSLAPFAGAAMVAISRTMDYRHHWQDVLTGSTLGTVVSYFAYRQYYPHLASAEAHRPFSPRIKRDDAETTLPMHHAPRTFNLQAARDSDETLHQPDGLHNTVPRPNSAKLGDIWNEERRQDDEGARRSLLTSQDADESHEMHNVGLGEGTSQSRPVQYVDPHAQDFR